MQLMDHAELAKAFGAFFAVMNPFVNLPIFLGLTTGFSVAQQRILAVKVFIFSAIMSAVVLLAGSAIIGFFGITVNQFRIAGGAVLVKIAWSMLNGTGISSHHGSDQERAQMANLSGLAFYPITFPMVVGPGTIASLIIYGGHTGNADMLMWVGIIVASILCMMLVVLLFAAQIGKVMSDTMRVITTRLMGMILLAIAVEMIVAGIAALLPGLAGT
jgi:multiple antibiotic resistance protein